MVNVQKNKYRRKNGTTENGEIVGHLIQRKNYKMV